MMQQPICQQEQIGGQQSVGHQMVLCPVRLVYETQILVQPGDQIHPNQTIFINQQNTPPWAQNRQVQNQILYVQQVPNNMAPSLQQHIDQNQLYLQQNYSNFQMQQAIMAQNSQEQIRPGLQITNMIPSNMLQHLQANVNSNIQAERSGGQTLTNFTQTHQNNQVANVIQNPITQNNRQIMANIGAINQSNQNSINTQTADLQRQGIYMNIRPQGIHQQVTPTRPIMTMNSTQNATNVQNMQQNFAQSFVQNVVPRTAQIQSNVNMQRGIQPMNMMHHIQAQAKPVEVVSTAVNVSQTVVNNPVQSIQTYAYRPIHPRPQYRQIAYNNTTMNNQTQTVVQSIPTKNANANINKDNRFISPPIATTVGTAVGYVNTDHPFRKRKSESPDEVHKKVVISSLVKESITGKYGSMTVKNISTPSEIGVNTSPVYKIDQKTAAKQNTLVQVNPIEAKVVKYVDNVQQTTLTESGAMKTATITNDTPNQKLNTSNQNEKEKMIRNTVYTQARGRVLNDKEEIKIGDNVVTNETKQDNIIVNMVSNDTKQNNVIEKPNTIDKKPPEAAVKLPKLKEVFEKSAYTTLIKLIEKTPNDDKNDVTDKQSDIELKTEIINSEKTNEQNIIAETKQENVKEQVKEEKTTIKEENTTIKEEKKMQIDENIEREKQFTLTHVLDGYVIQESNIAFPIRKPLKEKTLYTNAQELMEQQSKWDEDTTNKIKDEILKDSKSIDLPVLPFHCLHLNNNKKDNGEEVKKEEDTEKDQKNPFELILQSTLKSWTVDQVADHLSKFDWSQTVSVLQEHEIDGESLFLVTKCQLVNIGVREEHAEIICEFVKS